VAILGFIVPGAVIIEVVIADHLARNIFRGNRVVFFEVAVLGPAVEAIGTRGTIDIGFDVVVNAVEFGALTGMNFVSLAASSHFAFAANYRDAR
jgi:hypothetical protein